MKRRMISAEVISEGKFLRMSLTAQALYMHLLANADDDGCVDAYTISRLIGAKEDDLVLLKEREYITVLEEQEWILWITGWQEFNKIPPHVKENSKYLPLLRAKVKGIRIVKSTKEQDNKRRYEQLKTSRQSRKDNQVDPGNDPNRILLGYSQESGHDPSSRLGKDRIGENITPKPPFSSKRKEPFMTLGGRKFWTEREYEDFMAGVDAESRANA